MGSINCSTQKGSGPAVIKASQLRSRGLLTWWLHSAGGLLVVLVLVGRVGWSCWLVMFLHHASTPS